MAATPKTEPAVKVALSPYLDAVVYGRGSVMLVRGGRSFTLNDHESDRLCLARSAFLANGRSSA